MRCKAYDPKAMQRIPPELTRNARALRREQTLAERALWQALRDQKPRFTRQLVVGHFIIDLACRSAKVGIELDGSQHGEQIEADQQRTNYLKGARLDRITILEQTT
ncbi:endonuclease domain-containing protein [Sphingomonas sp. MMS24-JH45]